MRRLKERSRLSNLRGSMVSRGDCFLLTSASAIYYFSGFKNGEGMVLIPFEGENAIVTDGRYETQIEEEVDSGLFNILITPTGEYLKTLKEKIPYFSRLCVEDKSLLLENFLEIKEFWPGVEIVPTSDLILEIRSLKEEGEILLIKKAVKITEKAIKEVLPLIKVGISENDVAAEITYRQKKMGAEGDAFSLQVLAASHSALPHGRAGERIIKKGDLLQFDIGCVYEGYHSDISRAVVVGDRPTDEQKKIHQIVLDIQEQMIASIKPGVKLDELFFRHRDLLKSAGYEDRHSLGHGVGLEIHEWPSLGARIKRKFKAAPGQVFTVEPGIYLPGWGGIRIEDMVLVTEDGHKVLTRFPKDLAVLDV